MPSSVQRSRRHEPRLSRVELYRLISDEDRLRILALCADEELSVGELGTVLEDSQPQISRKISPLRQAGLLEVRRQGTRTLLQTCALDGDDAVLADALAEGRKLCRGDGSLARVTEVIRAREAPGVAHFQDDAAAPVPAGPRVENPTLHLAHLAALAPLLPARALAVDIGTGDGMALEVLSPLYERVIAVDRSQARLAQCAARISERGFRNVSLFPGSYDDATLMARVDAQGGADLVFAARTLHHASRPAQAISAFARLLKRGGMLVLLDYLPHDDESLRESQGDVWLGFDPRTLADAVTAAGLTPLGEMPLPAAFHQEGPDAHLGWFALWAQRPLSLSPRNLAGSPHP